MADRPPADSPLVKIARSLIMLGLVSTIAFITTFAQNKNNPNPGHTPNIEGTAIKTPKPTPISTERQSLPITNLCIDPQPQDLPVTDSAFFVGQENPADGATIQAGSTFEKSWTITNDGPAAWETGAVIHFVEGYRMQAPLEVDIPSAQAGETITIILTLKAPSQEGHYRADWRLCNARKLLFGPPLWVDINVTSGK